MAEGLRARHIGTAVIAVTALLPILVVAALTSDNRVAGPLVGILAAGAAISDIADVRFTGRLWLSGSFLCCLMAVAVLGPSAGVVVALASEVVAWAWCRFSFAPFVVNALGSVAPTWLAGVLLVALRPAVGEHGPYFDVAVALVTCVAIVSNVLIVSSLMSLHEGTSLDDLPAAYRRLAPFLAANVVLLVVSIETYREVGLAAAVSLLVVVLLFTYVVRLVVDVRERAGEVEELSADRSRLLTETLSAEERARRLLAEQLHDGPLQTLLVARQDLEEVRAGDESGLNRADAAMRETASELRNAVFDLHPAVLDMAGLEPAIVAVAEARGRRAGFETHVSVDPDAAGVADQLLFAFARELLTNAAKHSHAANVWLQVCRRRGSIELMARDDGHGFAPAKLSETIRAGHIGLASIRERVAAAGGTTSIDTTLGAGTSVTIRLPILRGGGDTDEPAGSTTPATRDA
jgi:signal transduction histidine kinase